MTVAMVRARIARAALLALAVPLIAAATDWTQRTARSSIGGIVMGNPSAPTRLVEYLSYTCVHCARFTNGAGEAIQANWVRRGAMTIEIRNAVRDRYDLTAAMLARCGGDARFFGNHAAIFANHERWMQQVAAHAKRPADPSNGSESQQLIEIGKSTGLYALMRKRGFTSRQLDACMADKGARAAILAMADEAWNKLKIGGTPAFSLNGELLDGVHDWPSLRARLPGAKPGTATNPPASSIAGLGQAGGALPRSAG